jgi:hypothetical protein
MISIVMNTEEMSEVVVEAAIDNLRQMSFSPFWRSKIEVTPYDKLHALIRDSRVNDVRLEKILESAANKRSCGSFDIEVSTKNRYANGDYERPSMWIILKNGHEWSDAIKDAWFGIESANPWFLSDNALKLLEWINGQKNTGDFIPEKRLGAQADLRGSGSYSLITEYVREIGLKTPHTVQMERSRTYGGDYKLKLIPNDECPTSEKFSNPVFESMISRHEKESLDAYVHMLEELVLDGEFGDAECCILFDIHSRTDLLKALPDLANREDFTPNSLSEFLKGIRLPRGLKVAASLSDQANEGWRMGAVLEEGWTWEEAKESVREERDRNDPCMTYGLSSNAGKILTWIWSLHDDEIHMGMTPCVENAARDQIGVGKLDYDQNSKVILQLLIEEINEKTPYSLSIIPWHEYPRGQHRILMRKKENPEAEITRMIQILGLEKNVALSASIVEKAIQDLWGRGVSLTDKSNSNHR